MGRKSNSRNRGFWFWAARQGWYHTCPITGRRLLLTKGPNDKATRLLAESRYTRLKAEGGLAALVTPEQAPQVKTMGTIQEGDKAATGLIGAFLTYKSHTVGEKAHRLYTYVLKFFGQKFGQQPIEALTLAQIEDWFSTKDKANGGTWGESHLANARKTIKCMYSFAVREGMVKVSPVRDMVAGQVKSRTAFYTPEQIAQVLAISDKRNPNFSDFFRCAIGTGSRPGEIAKLQAANITDHGDFLVGTLPPGKHKNGKKTGKDRNIVFRNGCAEIVRRLMVRHPEGPLFRSHRGKPWKDSRWGDVLLLIRRQLGLPEDLVVYSARHTHITTAINRGIPVMTLADLCGTSPQVIYDHYAHLLLKDKVAALSVMD